MVKKMFLGYELSTFKYNNNNNNNLITKQKQDTEKAIKQKKAKQ